jgi:CRP/FNR family transcriptional regulator, anaerobic regulatory protein
VQRTANSRVPFADDGSDIKFCSTCAFGAVCMPSGHSKTTLQALHCLVEHVGPFREGEHLFTAQEAFSAIFAVRGGTVKTRLIDSLGREQVLGFYLPGEMVGLNAIHPERYPCDAIALDTVFLCRFSFPALATLATQIPGIQQQLFRMLSKDIGAASMLSGDFSADERVAAFLVAIADRYAARGIDSRNAVAEKPRADIANYLRLAAETISRVLRRFQQQGLISVAGRDVEFVDPAAVRALARNVLHS